MSDKLKKNVDRFKVEGEPCGSSSCPSSPSKGRFQSPEEDAPLKFAELLQSSVISTETAHLTCKLLPSELPYKISWKKNTNSITNSEKYKISRNGDAQTLEITSMNVADSGEYTCVATCILGAISCTSTLTVLGVPEPPSKPRAVEKMTTSLLLAWEPNPLNGGKEVTAYTVEYKETGVSVWQAAVPFVAGVSTLIDDLTPGATYQFRVSANNSIGISRPSEHSDIIILEPDNDTTRDQCKTADRQPKACDITWKTDIDSQYNIYAELGRGRFSVVKKCVEKITGKESAAKLIKKRLTCIEDVQREISILKKLKHPNLCSFVDVYDTPKSYLIVLELLSGGRLFDYLVVMDNLTEKTAIGYVHEIVEGVQHLHDLNIVHLDLKPQNFLLDGGPLPKVKIIDFGSARELTGKPTTHPICGSPEFTAPELINSEPVTTKMDMWSIGVVSYVMLSGVSPYQADTTEDMCDKIRKEKLEFPDKYFSSISTHAQNFISSLLHRDTTARADCQDCLKSTWIRMMSPRPPSPVRTTKLNTSRLAAFNARRRNQHDLKPLTPNRTRSSTKSSTESDL